MSERMSKDPQSTTLLAALPPLLFGLVMSLMVLSYVPLSQLVWNGATPLRAFQRQPTWLVLASALLLCLALAPERCWDCCAACPVGATPGLPLW